MVDGSQSGSGMGAYSARGYDALRLLVLAFPQDILRMVANSLDRLIPALDGVTATFRR